MTLAAATIAIWCLFILYLVIVLFAFNRWHIRNPKVGEVWIDSGAKNPFVESPEARVLEVKAGWVNVEVKIFGPYPSTCIMHYPFSKFKRLYKRK